MPPAGRSPRDRQSDAPIEVAVVLERIGGDRGLLREMAEIFVAEYPERLEALRQAVRSGDAAEIEFAAHGLRSALQIFGADAAGALARELEAMARAGDVAGAPAVFARLESEMERLLAFFADPRWQERT